MPVARPQHKYRAKPCVIDNVRFASQKEARRYGELKLLEKAGEITGLEIQPRYVLSVRGVKIGEYRGDFTYIERVDGQWFPVVEDAKSPATRTAIYKWKKKHMLAEHGIEIREV